MKRCYYVSVLIKDTHTDFAIIARSEHEAADIAVKFGKLVLIDRRSYLLGLDWQ